MTAYTLYLQKDDFMYQVLYRKWRPACFADVSGQPQVTQTLKNEIKNGRIHHAYLFTGSRGTGKTTCAKILAKAVNCLDPKDGEPCGHCQNCIDFADGNMLDVIEMDAASNRRIDDIRALIDEVSFSPAKGKYRVYIVDEVHMLTNEAFNALLKTLEEPPAHVIFILATTEVHKLLPTILSRCQRFDFHRIAPEDIADRLEYIASQENITITREAALLTAVIADGAMRDSLSIMDRCIGINSAIDADVVRQAAGLAQTDYLFTISAACINKNVRRAIDIIDKLHSESKDMAKLCAEIINHFRNFMLIKTVKNPRNMLIMNDSEFEEAQTQCDYVSLADIIYFMDVLQRSAERMGKSSSDRTELETALVKLSSPELDGSPEALIARIVKLEKQAKLGGLTNTENLPPLNEDKLTENKKAEQPVAPPTTAEPAPSTEPAEQTQNQPQQSQTKQPTARRAVNQEELYANARPFPEWAEIVENMKNYSMTIGTAFSNSAAFVSGDFLLIDVNNDMAFNLLRHDPNQKERIRTAVQEMTGKRYKLGPYKPPVQEIKKDDPLKKFAEDLTNKGIEFTEE